MPGPTSFLQSYLEPIAGVLQDPEVVEVAVNPNGCVWLERQGGEFMVEYKDHMFAAEEANNLGMSIASAVGAQFSEKKPIFSGKVIFEDRPLRAQVVSSPVIEGGTAITLRSYSQKKISLEKAVLLHGKLVDLDALRRERAERVSQFAELGDISAAMSVCVEDRLNILVSGGTSTGKTTFARGLLELVPPAERIVTIEDAYELFPEQRNSVCLKASRSGSGETTPAKLLEGTLRMRPDRIILGEIRGEESKTFLDAINTGHGGSFTTIHADTAPKAIDRLALMIMSVGINMTFEEVRRYCASSIDVVIQLGRIAGRRGVVELYLPGMDTVYGG